MEEIKVNINAADVTQKMRILQEASEREIYECIKKFERETGLRVRGIKTRTPFGCLDITGIRLNVRL